MKNKIGLGLILVFAILQIFQIDKIEHQPADENDLFAVETANDELKLLVQKACYNCHSNQIDYPWYASVAPISWWIQDHIEHGREHLNFSDWKQYPADKKAHKAEEVDEEVEEGEMPLESYTFIHQESNLSEEERTLIINWFKAIEAKYSE